MTDRRQDRGAGSAADMPKPTCIRPRQLARTQPSADCEPGPAAGPGSPSDGQHGAPAPAPRGPAPAPASTPPGGQGGPADSAQASRRGNVRDALGAALSGVALDVRERQFLSRLAHWDKRNAAAVAGLLERARSAGRDEAVLSPRHIDLVLGALADAAAYRDSGAAVLGCWDCENIPGGRCADHARDTERARAYADAAVALTGSRAAAGRAAAGLPEPTDIAGYRSRKPVAS